ncbi:hypothetical protein SAMN04488543_4224 [Friedmanniella luteola]|uniref:Ligand-binding SRPBCC domain-containing protein n=1 Tax=Friedmanniella luteola TaxID=546871 RepID=A0A1H2A570_9ACTN|nr:hypothetical protein [Friedmanniella luteola]SDT41039.1 hypothetical protein SAMN04488543_4224 [Friedmanniella luteola]
MRLRLTVLLPCPPERLVAELARTRWLNRLDAPVLRFDPLDPPTFPERWRTADYRVGLRVGGRLPLGQHTLVVRRVLDAGDPLADGPTEIWHDAGHSALVRTWDHRVVVEAVHGMTRCTDVAEIRAGLLTLPAWLFAQVLYRVRGRRLTRLAGHGFADDALDG